MKKIGFADEIRRLRSEGYSYRKIQDILKCSKGTISKYCSTDETAKRNERAFKTQEEINMLHDYLVEHTYKEAAIYFGVSETSVKHYAPGKRKKTARTYDDFLIQQKEHKRKLRAMIKKQCIEYLGGKCKLCGYNKCDKALDFHHVNPEKKDFSIGQNNTRYRFDQLKPELDKCVLLCKNCHAEVHAGLIHLQIPS